MFVFICASYVEVESKNYLKYHFIPDYGLTSAVLERGLDRIEVFKARYYLIYRPIQNKSTTKNEASRIESLDAPETLTKASSCKHLIDLSTAKP